MYSTREKLVLGNPNLVPVSRAFIQNRRLRCPLGKGGRTQPIEWSKRRPTACMGRSTK